MVFLSIRTKERLRWMANSSSIIENFKARWAKGEKMLSWNMNENGTIEIFSPEHSLSVADIWRDKKLSNFEGKKRQIEIANLFCASPGMYMSLVNLIDCIERRGEIESFAIQCKKEIEKVRS